MRMTARGLPRWLRHFGAWGIPIALASLAGCNGTIGDEISSYGTGTGAGSGGAGSTTTTGTTTGTGTVTGGGPMLCQDQTVHAGRSPIRRLTRFEYNNTVHDLFNDTTSPANSLPPEEIGNGFGNDADTLSVSGLLAEQYGIVAEGIADRVTATPATLATLAPCAATVTAATEDACAHAIIDGVAPKMYRRPLAADESDAIFALYKSTRSTANATFAIGISSVLQALLQSPDFLYRIEFGVPDAAQPTLKRPSGDEMATRLSYLFWGTLPDDTLRDAAKSGDLLTASGVLAQATRMLDDARSHDVVRFFFDNLLPVNGLTDIQRDKTMFPSFSLTVGGAMREETQSFLEYEIFQGEGTWPAAFTAPYTFVNGMMADFYGMTGVTGTAFVKVPQPDPTKRLGFLTQAGVMTGTITTNQSNPVLRGSFVVNKLLCRHINLPTDPAILAQVKVPADTSGATARERFSKHSTQAICAACHQFLDPIGFMLENYDPVGQYRTEENGVTIDASGIVPGTTDTINGGVELSKKLASMDEAQFCFASHWLDFAYGRTTGDDDACAQAAVDVAFQKSNYDVKQMLLALTQTDEFLYYPGGQ